jgi:hypothetical protein
MLLILPPPTTLPVISKIKESYRLWFNIYKILPKTHRYSLGTRIDTLFIESLEFVTQAVFVDKKEKQYLVTSGLRKIDTIKILMTILWEERSIDNKKYASLIEKMEEVGRMLGGWLGQLRKQNSPAEMQERK